MTHEYDSRVRLTSTTHEYDSRVRLASTARESDSRVRLVSTPREYDSRPPALPQNTLEYLTFAALSKVFAATTTYPYQVLRARLQDQHRSYTGVIDVTRTTYRQVMQRERGGAGEGGGGGGARPICRRVAG